MLTNQGACLGYQPLQFMPGLSYKLMSRLFIYGFWWQHPHIAYQAISWPSNGEYLRQLLSFKKWYLMLGEFHNRNWWTGTASRKGQ